MGFFASSSNVKKRAAKAAQRVSARGVSTTARTAQTAATLARMGCATCPLRDADVMSPKMEPILVKGGSVYILGEAPGAEEDKRGEPFVGVSGRLLRRQIPNAFDDDVSIDNVVRNRPPNNRTPTWVEMESCRGNVTRSIEQAKPKLIIGLGAVPLNWMLNTTDMKGMRGRFFAVKIGNHECWFMPTYHPSFILRQGEEADRPLKSKFGRCWELDLKRAFDFVGDCETPRIHTAEEARANIETFEGGDGEFEKVMELIDAALVSDLSGIDLETFPIRPHREAAAILTVAISYSWKNSFAFALDHPQAKWSAKQKKALKSKLEEFIVSEKVFKVAHNAPFELEWFGKEYGPEIVKHDQWGCTQMQAYFLDERGGKDDSADQKKGRTYQKLDFLTVQHYGISIKKLSKVNIKDMRKTTLANKLSDTLIYNAIDAKYCRKLYILQERYLEEQGLLDVYERARRRQPTVALMQLFGIPTDQKNVIANEAKLRGEISKLHTEIRGMKVVRQFEADNGEFNPASQPHTLTIFRDYLKREEINVPVKYAKEGEAKFKEQVDAAVLNQIDHPLAPAIIRFRNRSKMKSTYVDDFIIDPLLRAKLGLKKPPLVYPDGKIHSSFNTTFTTTNRLSSDDPNAQNWPKRNDAWLRNEVFAGEGNLILAADYGQLEGCTAAMNTGDHWLINAIWDKYDIHMDWAKKIAKMWPEGIGGEKFLDDPKVMKDFRSRIKNKWVFPALFGASINSLAAYTGMPLDFAEELEGIFWDHHYETKRWQDRLWGTYKKLGQVETLGGWLRRYPMSRNEVINAPIQGTAAEIVCEAMCNLSEIAAESGEWHLHPILNIHDDLTFIVPDNDSIVADAIEILKKQMLVMPFDWVNVPLSIEVSVGTHWDAMEEVGKFFSNEEYDYPVRKAA